METDLILSRDNVMQRLGSHELTRRWLSDHPNGWDDQAFQKLRSQLSVAGFGLLEPDALEARLGELRDLAKPDPSRVAVRRPLSHDEIHRVERLGTAEWSDPDDIAERHGFRIGDLWLGRSPMGGEPIGYSDDRHALLACGTRGGKGASVILPNLMLWPGSMVVMDPKGENASVAAARRGDGNEHVLGMGQSVAVLDPMGVAQCEGKYRKRYNPLDAIDTGSPDAADQAAILAEAMIIRTGHEKDDYWKDEAEAALQALLLHVKTSRYLDDTERNLVTLRRFILRGDIDLWRKLRAEGDEDLPSPHTLLFTSMKNNEAGGDIVMGMGADLLHMSTKGEKQWIGVRAALRTQTRFLDSPKIQACVAASDISLDALKNDPDGMSLFLCLPLGGKARVHKRWLRLMLNAVADVAQRSLEPPKKGYPVLWCLDEFAALEQMPVIEEGIATLAGYGVKLLIVLQDLGQLKAKYQDNWQTFLANVSVQLYFSIEDQFTREFLSKDIGETEIVVNPITRSETYNESRSRSAQRSRSKGRTRSVNETETATLTRAEQLGYGRTWSHADQRSQSKAVGESSSQSVGHSRSRSATNTKNQGWKPPRLFWRSTVAALPFLRDGETAGVSNSTGEQEGTNTGSTTGQNVVETEGTGTVDTEGGSTNKSTTNSEGLAIARALQEGTNESTTVGEQEGVQGGRTQGVTVGEVYHKRALVTSDQIREYFARLEQDDFAYPGLGMLKISNERWAITQRSYYFDDIYFDGFWDKHPTHAEYPPSTLWRTLTWALPMPKQGELWADGHEPRIGRWFKSPGDTIIESEPLFEILPGRNQNGLVDHRIPIPAPISGVLEKIETDEGQVFDPDAPLAVIRYHLSELED